jgi:hypothetical protein
MLNRQTGKPANRPTGQRANWLNPTSQILGGIGAPFPDGDNTVFLESFGNGFRV